MNQRLLNTKQIRNDDDYVLQFKNIESGERFISLNIYGSMGLLRVKHVVLWELLGKQS